MPDHVFPLVVVTGVSGSGKSTIGRALARQLGVPYEEGDDLHPPGNIEKMEAGVPLTDEDRAPWLERVAGWLRGHLDRGGVITCSALKRRYRDRLAAVSPRVFFLHLHGPAELIAARITARRGHFMPPSLLRSQFDALEPPAPDEHGAEVSVEGTPEETTALALAAVRAAPP
ncbi:gluconokinase, GntK/IdnK-type [Streptomyces sp. TRM76323]|uniref:Gluconokinase n=1 Tax=Streptomyces tamarix TaxID=3078565 RepID=A0ABU3QP19_9ACTN|nr:gluconokinase, GntK/IdnK-type [Streptomyces tamarix]MDT9684505.1 gluconokinase, GntK/IdnK-type [Streptomyces tamarix]